MKFIAPLIYLLSCITVSTCTGLDDEYQAIFFWNTFSDFERSEFVRFFLKTFNIKVSDQPANISESSPSHLYPSKRKNLEDITRADITQMIESGTQWEDLVEKYIKYNSEDSSWCTKLTILVEIVRKASVETFQNILETFPSVVDRYFIITSAKLVEILLKIRYDCGDIIRFIKLFERYFDFDLAAHEELVKMIRIEGFRRDSYVLLEFITNYPLNLPPISDSEVYFDMIFDICCTGRKACTWDFVINDSTSRSLLERRYSDTKCVKFEMFSAPVEVCNWSIDMFALACEDFDHLRSFPLKTFPSSSSIHNMIPLIPDEAIRSEMCRLYGMDPSTPRILEFNQGGTVCKIIGTWERTTIPQKFEYVPPDYDVVFIGIKFLEFRLKIDHHINIK